MAKIECPKCGEIIELGKDQYNALLSEIGNEEIEKRVSSQQKQIEEKYKATLELEKAKLEKSSNDLAIQLNQKIAELQGKLDNFDKDKQIAVTDAENKLNQSITEKDQEIAKLQSKIDHLEEMSEKDKELAINKAVADLKDELSSKKSELVELEGKIKSIESDNTLALQQLKEKYERQLSDKDYEIQRWKDHVVGDSTKDIGESLENYCRNKFNSIRTYAYPNAKFEKDTTAKEGTEGDFIFRDYSDDDKENEMVSIMFEMKNQKEDGHTKNETHLEKLHKDRVKKGCEYAVLVSTLEPENEFYNQGIVDISYIHDKMYVVRPQFFLAIIGLIKNMAKTRFEYKQQVIAYTRENVDITNFETAVKEVAKKINEDYEKAGAHYADVEKMCDDMIKKLNDLKEAFRLGQKWIGAAKNQLPELEIRKLTKDNPTMKARFDALEEKKGSAE